MRVATIMLFCGILIIAGGVFLQIFLSRRQNKWLGLILPTLTFVYSLIMILSVATLPTMSGGEVFMFVATTFLVSNVPTIVLLGIYLGCRDKLRRRTQLDKMNIQDLE